MPSGYTPLTCACDGTYIINAQTATSSLAEMIHPGLSFVITRSLSSLL
jgi:hypothetical protein